MTTAGKFPSAALSERWLRLDSRRRMTLRVAAAAAVLVNVAAAWTYHEVGGAEVPAPARPAPVVDPGGPVRSGLGDR